MLGYGSSEDALAELQELNRVGLVEGFSHRLRFVFLRAQLS